MVQPKRPNKNIKQKKKVTQHQSKSLSWKEQWLYKQIDFICFSKAQRLKWYDHKNCTETKLIRWLGTQKTLWTLENQHHRFWERIQDVFPIQRKEESTKIQQKRKRGEEEKSVHIHFQGQLETKRDKVEHTNSSEMMHKSPWRMPSFTNSEAA